MRSLRGSALSPGRVLFWYSANLLDCKVACSRLPCTFISRVQAEHDSRPIQCWYRSIGRKVGVVGITQTECMR